MKNKIEKLSEYQIQMSWVILEYNVMYFIDSDFAGKYMVHPSWYEFRRVNDSIYDSRWNLFKNLSLFLSLDFVNEVSFDPTRPSAKLILDKFQSKAENVIAWPEDVEEIFEKIITGKTA